MKYIILISTLWVIAISTDASQFVVRLSKTNDAATLVVNSKIVSREEAKAIFQKMGNIEKDLAVFVFVDGTVPAATLIETVHDLQSANLHALVLTSPAVVNGKKGWYEITVDCTKRPFSGCVGGSRESGFQESPEYELEEINETADRPKGVAPYATPRRVAGDP